MANPEQRGVNCRCSLFKIHALLHLTVTLMFCHFEYVNRCQDLGLKWIYLILWKLVINMPSKFEQTLHSSTSAKKIYGVNQSANFRCQKPIAFIFSTLLQIYIWCNQYAKARDAHIFHPFLGNLICDEVRYIVQYPADWPLHRFIYNANRIRLGSECIFYIYISECFT